MKKLLALVMALCMMLSCVSALAESTFEPAASYDTSDRAYYAGEVTLNAAEGGSSGTINKVRYAGIEGKDYTDEKVYTLNDYIGGTTSMDWNPQTWETSDDSLIVSYQTTPLYGFYLNETLDGYAILPEAAADYPVDVTAEYVGQYGVEEGETAKAWRITLNPDMVWSTGEKITADDYIYSMQQQLNPKMLNRRADSYYAGDMVIYNAKNYLYAGKTTYDLVTDTAENLMANGETVYLDMDFWGLVGCLDADGNECPQYVDVNDETLYRDTAVEESDPEGWISAKYLFDNYLADGAVYAAYQSSYLYTAKIAEGATWDEVGLKKIDDYTIDLILEKAVEEAEFYMPYNLSSNWLVYEPVYEACKSFYANGVAVETEEEADEVTTNYCTSLETNVSYGPYVLTVFELDKQIRFERNDSWFGYSDGKHLGLYQTDVYDLTVIGEHDTAMMAFLSGELTSTMALDSDEMETYAASDALIYIPQTYTTKISFNTNYEKLLEHGTNSQIMVIDEFREAFSLALDRTYFATAFTAAHQAGYGLLNYLYCYNPFTGGLYRDNDYAKEALIEVYGLKYGEGEDYATLDEAYEAMTGYDMEKAKELMQVAYDKAVAAGIYDGVSDITIDFRVYDNDTVYVQMFTYFDTQLKTACEGTGFEGKISMTMTADPDYYETNYSGGADIIFTTWGGASMAPFTMMNQCYTDAYDGSGNQMEYGFNTEEIALTITAGGKDLTFSLYDWSNWVGGTKVEAIEAEIGTMADYDYDTRCGFMAAIEECFLSYYTTAPLYYRNSASLVSRKMSYAADSYIQIMGYGDLESITYNYDDAEWTEFVNSGELKY